MISELRCVDKTFISLHDEDPSDISVCRELEIIRPDIFANGGDRRSATDIPETETCQRLGIEMCFNVDDGRLRSSSKLLDRYYHPS